MDLNLHFVPEFLTSPSVNKASDAASSSVVPANNVQWGGVSGVPTNNVKWGVVSPSDNDIWGTPRTGRYSDVRRYITERKKGDPAFKDYCLNHSLRDLCLLLTDIFGWYVDENSLQKNLNRNR